MRTVPGSIAVAIAGEVMLGDREVAERGVRRVDPGVEDRDLDAGAGVRARQCPDRGKAPWRLLPAVARVHRANVERLDQAQRVSRSRGKHLGTLSQIGNVARAQRLDRGLDLGWVFHRQGAEAKLVVGH